jgi:hypothetical protein
MATVTGSGTAAREISTLVKAASEWTSKAIVISANTKTRTRDLMVPLVARECGKIGQNSARNGSFVAGAFPE